jgi:hypothetical protein
MSSLTPQPNYLPPLTTPTADDPAQDQLVIDWGLWSLARAAKSRSDVVH